jgi:replicative DNA helicase
LSLFAERVPPQNLEAEQSVLAAMLIEREAIIRASEILTSEDFYRDAHGAIFLAMMALFERGEPVDLITVSDELRGRGLLDQTGGLTYLAKLSNLLPSAANVEYYAKIVEEKAVLRRLIRASTDIARKGYDGGDDLDDLLGEAERTIFDITQKRTAKGYEHLKNALVTAYDHIEFLYTHKGQTTGVPTGFRPLDQMMSGLQPSDLLILAARPSVGKTGFALNIARNAAVLSRVPVAFFSLEMAKEQLALRLLSAEAAVDGHRMRTGHLADDDWMRLGQALGRLSEAPIFIDDTPNIALMELRARARRLKTEQRIRLIVIDYLQLMQAKSKSDNRQQEVSEISRSLKALARELRVPVIALSQLSRAAEQRQDKRPLLSDLRESGSIEQDADVVMFLFREDYYDAETERKNICEVIIAKHRNGPTGSVDLYFMKEIQKFMAVEPRRE